MVMESQAAKKIEKRTVKMRSLIEEKTRKMIKILAMIARNMIHLKLKNTLWIPDAQICSSILKRKVKKLA